MPSEIEAEQKKSASWCRDICRGADPHKILDFLSTHLDRYSDDFKLNLRTVRSLDDKLPILSVSLDKAECNRLYALAIETLRKSAFVNISADTHFVWRCYSLIKTVWNKEYKNTVKSRTNTEELIEPIFDPDDFIGGWIRDLDRVTLKSLFSYIQILSCDGLASCATFPKALEVLKERLLQRIDTPELSIIDKCGEALIRHVLDPMISTDRKTVIDSLLSASEIASMYALYGFYDSIESLDTLLRHLGQPEKTKREKVRKADEHLAQAYSDVLPILSETYHKARQKGLSDLCFRQANIIPIVGDWRRDRRRKAPPNFNIVLEILVGEDRTQKEFRGSVKEFVRDFGVDRPYCHVCFDDLIDCFPIRDSEEPLPGEEKHNSIMLCVTDKTEVKYMFREALAVLEIPNNCPGKVASHEESVVRPIRGWKYKYTNEGKVGVVFWLKNPPTLNLEQLQIVLDDQGEAEETAKPKEAEQCQECNIRFRKGGQFILQDICEWFENFSNLIRWDRRYRGFWTRSGKKGLRPVDELAIDGQIRKDLREFVESHYGTLSCQEDTGWGSCDYIVRYNNVEIVIELKPSYGEWKNGISKQLPDYMEAKHTRYGLFLVFSFEGKFRKNSKEVKDLQRLRDGVCKKRNICIDIIVISCDKPGAASRKNKLLHPEDHFQYYKGPSPEVR